MKKARSQRFTDEQLNGLIAQCMSPAKEAGPVIDHAKPVGTRQARVSDGDLVVHHQLQPAASEHRGRLVLRIINEAGQPPAGVRVHVFMYARDDHFDGPLDERGFYSCDLPEGTSADDVDITVRDQAGEGMDLVLRAGLEAEQAPILRLRPPRAVYEALETALAAEERQVAAGAGPEDAEEEALEEYIQNLAASVPQLAAMSVPPWAEMLRGWGHTVDDVWLVATDSSIHLRVLAALSGLPSEGAIRTSSYIYPLMRMEAEELEQLFPHHVEGTWYRGPRPETFVSPLGLSLGEMLHEGVLVLGDERDEANDAAGVAACLARAREADWRSFFDRLLSLHPEGPDRMLVVEYARFFLGKEQVRRGLQVVAPQKREALLELEALDALRPTLSEILGG